MEIYHFKIWEIRLVSLQFGNFRFNLPENNINFGNLLNYFYFQEPFTEILLVPEIFYSFNLLHWKVQVKFYTLTNFSKWWTAPLKTQQLKEDADEGPLWDK